MAALVADYGDSSTSEPDSDREEDANTVSPSEGKQLTSALTSDAGINFLTGVVGNGSSESEEEDASAIQSSKHAKPGTVRLPNPLAEIPVVPDKLPPPSLQGTGVSKAAVGTGSVFANPFQKAEDVKHSILEQHVKMTASSPQTKEKSGKKVCWNFRKGKCRFGHKCKYAHDSDINPGLSEDDVAQSNRDGKQTMTTGQFGVGHWSDQVVEPEPEDEDSYMAQSKRKHRAGVGDGLVPPKRAAHALGKQRAQERPWTVNK